MTARPPHARYEELVVGYALSALEPQDEQELVRHLPSCAACERDLALHRETLAQLAYAGAEVTPPPALWETIRRDVVELSGPGAFSVHEPSSRLSAVSDLRAARIRRLTSPRARRVAAWTSLAAALVLGVALGAGLPMLHPDHGQQGVSDRLAAAVRAVETGPARTVPLTGKNGRVSAVAVVQSDRLSLIVDGLPRNDPASSVYVLWGQSGTNAPQALATFDVPDGKLDVVRDLPLGAAGGPRPELYVITKEAGRTAPNGPQTPALATGRAA